MEYILTGPQLDLFIRRRFSPEELDSLIEDAKELIDGGGMIEIIAIYDAVREFIKSKKFSDIDEFGDDQSYWESYLKYEKPLVAFVKYKLGLK
jgi:hypothetical protein